MRKINRQTVSILFAEFHTSKSSQYDFSHVSRFLIVHFYLHELICLDFRYKMHTVRLVKAGRTKNAKAKFIIVFVENTIVCTIERCFCATISVVIENAIGLSAILKILLSTFFNPLKYPNTMLKRAMDPIIGHLSHRY